ncbi:MAG: hypothetical protein AAGJ46_02885 [Planctomycetota bacterium]
MMPHTPWLVRETRDSSANAIEPIVIATYVALLGQHYSRPTVKLYLAAIRMLFDCLVTRHIVPSNPAAAVCGPRYVVTREKTPVLTAAEARELLDSIEALIGVLVYSLAWICAALRTEPARTLGGRLTR